VSLLQRYRNGNDKHWPLCDELDLSILPRHENAHQVSLHRMRSQRTNGIDFILSFLQESAPLSFLFAIILIDAFLQVQRKKITVPVPAGVEDGQTIRLAVGRKEIFVTFRVEKSRYFRRDGPDVHTDAEVSLAQAVLGGTIRVEGVYDDQTIQIMPGTSSHTRIRLSGKGLKKVDGIGYGDHYVNIKITIPKQLTDKQQALLQAYAELETDTPGSIYGVTNKMDGKDKQ